MSADELTIPAPAVGRFTEGATLRIAGRWRRTAALQRVAPVAVAMLSGVAFATAFPPLSWTIAAWVSLAPLLVICARLSPRRAAIAGMSFATAAAIGVAWFLPGMLSRYFGLATVPSWLAAVAIAGGLNGLWVAGYAAWVAWLAHRRAANPILLAAGWLACEMARSHGVLGSQWALAAYSQLGWAPLIQIADLAGPYGIGFLIAAVNACLAAGLAPSLRGRRPLLSVATIATALAAAIIYGHWRLGETFDDGPAVRVAVVQGGAPAVDPARRAARLAHYAELTRRRADAPTDLIVWPEYALESYLEEASPARDTVLRVATDAGADLILGGPHYESSPSGTRYHNSAYLVRGGHLAARYDKHHLVPFAEDDRLAWLRGERATSYTPGPGAFVLPGTALRLGTLLCVEAMFPDLARQAAAQGAEVLVNLSNDAWFGDPDPARQQFDMATLRAVENRRYLVRAAATGFSAVIDPHGRLLAQSQFATHDVLNATVHASHARTPYQRWGDAFAWMAIVGVLGASLRPVLEHTVRHNQRRFS